MKHNVNISKRQEEILSFVEQKKFASVSEIDVHLDKKGFRIAKVTVKRDLRNLIENQFLLTRGAGRSLVYVISPQFNLKKNIDTNEYFSISQDKRDALSGFNLEIFKVLENVMFTEEEQKKLNDLHQEFLSNFNKIDSKTILKKEFERILIEFSWKSSQIEGNTYSLLDTEALLKEKKAAKGKTKEEAQMILNHKIAFDFILQKKTFLKNISLAKIEKIHSMMIYNLGIQKNLRKIPVGIIGTNYKPLDNQYQIKEAILKIVQLINKKKDFFEKSFLILLLLSYTQAFEDGNKRTARMISNGILLSFGSTPISYRAVDEVEYKKATILFYEQNNLSYFKEIFIKQYEFAVKNYFR